MEFPVLPQDVIKINQQLIDHFGVDTISGKPMWRCSWSNDQYEKRKTKYTYEGLEMLHEEVKELPKYQWIKSKWILERLVLIPDVHIEELPSERQSYECMWVFEHEKSKAALPPNFIVAKFVVDTVYAAMGKRSMAKYVDEEAKNPIESREKRIKALEEELFGSESDLLGRTITGEAVGYTGDPTIDSPVNICKGD